MQPGSDPSRSAGPTGRTVADLRRTVRHVDQIYVLRDGRIVEKGTHGQLVVTGGLYRELFALQASGYPE